ncbi:hypothetical protein DPMN_191776 [Dreissena polymorpha]|uniref:Uncharacterized protein n=1 Tax=Dreissena polymorpha TaxID=45954 RepID=A0A9D3XXK4_DREPO|nr:hypothetical protein DPMN_191776 [Dreissena polymorpha]
MHGPITNHGAPLGQTCGVGIRVGLCRAISSFIHYVTDNQKQKMANMSVPMQSTSGASLGQQMPVGGAMQGQLVSDPIGALTNMTFNPPTMQGQQAPMGE